MGSGTPAGAPSSAPGIVIRVVNGQLLVQAVVEEGG
jgi:hypothetical protein